MPWYVMHSKPNKEEFLYDQLRIRNIETYYPCIKVNPVNPRSRKRKPYFPGYLFVRANLETIGTSTLQWTPGTLGLVDFGGELATVPDEVLETIRHQVERINEISHEKLESFKPGDMVRIQSGPLAGYHAIFDSRISGHERVRVLLQMLEERQVSVELSTENVVQLENHRSHSKPS